jgi:hypothetical protein
MQRSLCAVIVLLLCGTWLVAAGAKETTAQKCETAKLKAVGKKVACRTSEMAKATTGRTADLGKCTAKFTDAFSKAEAKRGCPTTGDSSAIEAFIDAATDEVDAALTRPRFVDNDDGTVTDNHTGLQWEKKVAGSACPHCVNDVYTWTSDTSSEARPNGTAFTNFLSGLNTCTSPDGTSIVGGFAGHCDWRLPTIVELESILDLGATGCGSGSPCIDPIFGPTAAVNYWSSTPYGQGRAWQVEFYHGFAFTIFEDDSLHARAVRSAL